MKIKGPLEGFHMTDSRKNLQELKEVPFLVSFDVNGSKTSFESFVNEEGEIQFRLKFGEIEAT